MTAEELAATLQNVHDPSECEGNPCWVHHPSKHHMVDWPVIWRHGRGVIERMCEHGVGHPDPDDIAYIERAAGGPTAEAMSVHGCDGCCDRRRRFWRRAIEWTEGIE